MLPVAPSGYRNLQCVGDKVYDIRQGSRDAKAMLVLFDLDKQKETELGEANGFEISADGKKMLLESGGGY